MKLNKMIYLLILFSLVVFIPVPNSPQAVSKAAQPFDIGEWQTGPYPPETFQYARHDGAFVPGPALEPWANKIYFPGGRTSPPTESPHVWMFDPVTNTYTDTGEDVYEDVSNYNANLVMDDGTGRGPAIYVIGGTDKDHGGVSIGTVQRYYPQTNEAEALGTEDNWNVSVGGARVAAMGTAVVNDVIYVYGGWESTAAPGRDLVQHDPAPGERDTGRPAAPQHAGHGAAPRPSLGRKGRHAGAEQREERADRRLTA